LQRLHQLKRAL